MNHEDECQLKLIFHIMPCRINRYCTKTTVIKGVTIPKGVAVVVPIYTIHHSELYWEDPEKFDPDR